MHELDRETVILSTSKVRGGMLRFGDTRKNNFAPLKTSLTERLLRRKLSEDVHAPNYNLCAWYRPQCHLRKQ